MTSPGPEGPGLVRCDRPAGATGGDPMVVVMAPEATQEDVDAIVELVRAAGGEAFVSRGVSRTIVGLVGDVGRWRADRPGHAHRDRRPVRGGVARADADGGADGQGSGRVAAARRRIQAAYFPVRLPGPG